MDSQNAVIVTGARAWQDAKLIYDRLAIFPEGTILIHGDCIGADKTAAEIAKKYFRFVLIEIPYIGWLGKGGGPVRNTFMLDLLSMYKNKGSITSVIGFHEDLWFNSAGTKDMINKAKLQDNLIDHLSFISGWCCRRLPDGIGIGHPNCIGYIENIWNGHGFVAKCSQRHVFDHETGAMKV